jgi:ribosomal protein L7Ae-like RNA K-turn-binding protein
MRKIYLIMLVVLACGVSIAENVENIQRYYDDNAIECTVPLPKVVDLLSYTSHTWQLCTPHGRVMAQGKVTRTLGKYVVKVPLKFDKLKPGISLKLSLQIRYIDKKVMAQQKMIIYSKKIFANVSGKLKKLGAGAILPEDEIAGLNALGLELPEVPLSNFENPANKVIFCAAKEYTDNIDMLSELMRRGVTLIMFAPDNESEIYLPLKNFLEMSLISSKHAKTKGALGVICNKEKIAVTCDSGQGDLIKIAYDKGKIIIVADAVYKNLDKTPEAALMLKNELL